MACVAAYPLRSLAKYARALHRQKEDPSPLTAELAHKLSLAQAEFRHDEGDFNGQETVSRTITLYLVRHAEALHNVEEKLAMKEVANRGGSQEEANCAREDVLRSPNFRDSPLSASGQQQATSAGEALRARLKLAGHPAPEMVLVSPLTRTLETASLLFPGHGDVRALELLREKRTGRPCDERRPSGELAELFPGIDFADVEAADAGSGAGTCFGKGLQEDNAAVMARSLEFLRAFQALSCEAVAVVTHKAFLRELGQGLAGHVVDEHGRGLAVEFGNAEVRMCQVGWTAKGRPLVRVLPL